MRVSVIRLMPAAILLACPAFAQMAGTYTGSNSEGYDLEVVVSGSTGDFAITGVSDGGNVYCKSTEIGAWGLGIGTDDPINGSKASLNIDEDTEYYNGTFNFSGNQVVVKQLFVVPVLTGTKTPPKTACAASTGTITTTLTFSGADTGAPGPTFVKLAPIAMK